MIDTINFVDLVALTRITPESTVEKFGGLINSSFFDASNILGTLKQKGLVDFVTSFPTQSAITITDQGKALIDETKQKADMAFDTLDMTVLTQLSSGKKNLGDINSAVNVTSKDLAIHLYKLSKQEFISYDLRNGNIDISMTEKGFLKVKEGASSSIGNLTQADNATQMQGAANMQPDASIKGTTDTTAQMPPPDVNQVQAKIMKAKQMKGIMVFGIMIVVVLVILYLAYVLHLLNV